MNRLLLFTTFILLITQVALSQKVYDRSYPFGTYDAHEMQKFPASARSRTVKEYLCKDTIFNVDACRCTTIKTYDDSGRIKRYVSGKDIKARQIDFIVDFTSIADSICTAITDYFPQYIDSFRYFRIDTIINGKPVQRDLYEREPNRHILVKSVLYFRSAYRVPDKVYQFDKHNELKEIYYPLGSDVPKTETNTIVTPIDSTVTETQQYPAYIYQTTTKYSRKGNQLEQTEGFKYGDSIAGLSKSIYAYNEKHQLISAFLFDKNHVLITTTTYQYQNGMLTSAKKDSQTDQEYFKYNDAGDLIEEHLIHLTRDSYRYVYTYKEGIKVRYDYYREGQFPEEFSIHYIFDE